jgi:GNAT superfamily N-acetyltransferase
MEYRAQSAQTLPVGLMLKIERISAAQTLPIRHAVLWPHQPMSFCQIPEDDLGWHIGASTDMGLVCVASLFMGKGQARLRKFASLPRWQGQGIGSQVLQHALTVARDAGCPLFWCDARVEAVPFYQRFGLQEVGTPFVREGICFVRMESALSERKI